MSERPDPILHDKDDSGHFPTEWSDRVFPSRDAVRPFGWQRKLSDFVETCPKNRKPQPGLFLVPSK
jgi:hypothetical protein